VREDYLVHKPANVSFEQAAAAPTAGFIALNNLRSINRAGFVMGDLHFAEIHYKDSERFPDGFNFYNVANGENTAEEIPLPNECVECHKRDAAYDGVFVQFYPVIHEHLPPDVRARLKHPDGHGAD